MSLADDFQAALERARKAQEEILAGYGSNPPPELAEHFQNVQDQTAQSTRWLRELSDRMEQSRAKVKAQLEAEAKGDRPRDEGVDFEAYPWQFKDAHGPPPEKVSQLLKELGVVETPSPKPAGPSPVPAKAPPLPAKAPTPTPAQLTRKRREVAPLEEQDGDTLDIRDFDG
jgi:hypothetical protein